MWLVRSGIWNDLKKCWSKYKATQCRLIFHIQALSGATTAIKIVADMSEHHKIHLLIVKVEEATSTRDRLMCYFILIPVRIAIEKALTGFFHESKARIPN
jgi:hypothetical protein